MKTITEISRMPGQAQKLCKRGIFDVCAADKKAVSPLLEVRAAVREYLAENPHDIEALRAAAYTECYLLNFRGGLNYLEKAVELSGDRKDKAKAATLRELAGRTKEMPLTPEEWQNLGDYLEANLSQCNHDMKCTKEWLDTNIDKKKHARIIKGLQSSGGYCDCEVLANAIVN